MDLSALLTEASARLIVFIARSIVRHRAAVISCGQTGSNGQTAGQSTRLQLVKRKVYSRRKLNRPNACLIGAA